MNRYRVDLRCPVRIEYRVGGQTDEIVFASVNRRPSRASRSIAGVFTRAGSAP